MPDLKGANARRAIIVQFSSTVEIEKTALDKAIGGGIKRAGLERSSRQLREEIFSTVYFRLSLHFSKGKPLKGDLGSLAFKVAQYVAIDTFRRPSQYARCRAPVVEIADAVPAVEMEMTIETAEQRIMRLADTEILVHTLTEALRKISAVDRATLIGMLERNEALPRKTAQEIKIANAAAQREKRAKDRLARAIRSRENLER